MKGRLFPILLLFPALVSAQNLVLNPSFEELKSNAIIVPCEFMQYSQHFDEKMRLWTTFKGMTPDVLQAADNCAWLQTAHTGIQCLGLILYLPASDLDGKEDYHEQVRGRLKAPLVPGQHYRVECWVREDSTIIREHLAKVYAPKTPVVPVKAGNLGFYFYARTPLENQKPQVNFAEVIQTYGQWVKLSAEFVPDEPFEYFILGNFFGARDTPNNLDKDQMLTAEQKNGKAASIIDKVKRGAYLCIDDVSVELVAAPRNIETTLLKERKITFSAGVLFDIDKSDLKPEAGPELAKLLEVLKKHPDMRLGISGHTDNTGADDYNLTLSEQRARAVQDYLIVNGIEGSRLRSKGFGETKPLADNLTETGRQANRRVECVLLRGE